MENRDSEIEQLKNTIAKLRETLAALEAPKQWTDGYGELKKENAKLREQLAAADKVVEAARDVMELHYIGHAEHENKLREALVALEASKEKPKLPTIEEMRGIFNKAPPTPNVAEAIDQLKKACQCLYLEASIADDVKAKAYAVCETAANGVVENKSAVHWSNQYCNEKSLADLYKRQLHDVETALEGERTEFVLAQINQRLRAELATAKATVGGLRA